jgi:predicted enzyme related to lactoylglutathione lyase
MRHMSGTIGFVLDCSDHTALAGFWSQALGYEIKGSGGQYVVLDDPAGAGPKLLLQRVDEPRSGKNRMHLDVHVHDIEREASRLEGLGATRLAAPQHEFNSTWIVMADPEGNEFCVCDGGPPPS